MPFPVMALLVGAPIVVGGVASYRQYKAQSKITAYQDEFYRGAYNENKMFWYEYRRRHHILDRPIKYPYRTGYNYDLSALQNAHLREMSAQNRVYSAWSGAGIPLGYYRRPAGYRSIGNAPALMYGGI